MTIQDDSAMQWRVGFEILHRLYNGGLFERVKREVTLFYAAIADGQTEEEASTHIKTALDMPNRMRVRINNFMDVYDGGGTTLIGTCINLATGGEVTLSSLNATLTTYENWCLIRVNASPPNDNTMTWTEIAQDLENAIFNQYQSLILPLSGTDVWGDSY